MSGFRPLVPTPALKGPPWRRWTSPWTPILWALAIHAGAVIVLFILGIIGAFQKAGTTGESMLIAIATAWVIAGVLIAPTITILAIIVALRLQRRRKLDDPAPPTGAPAVLPTPVPTQPRSPSRTPASSRSTAQPRTPAASVPVITPVRVEKPPVRASFPLARASPGPVPGLSFAAVDFETANNRRGSVCAIGVAIVVDGEVVATHHHLVRPTESMRSFTNTHIHGIRESDVRLAPEWPAIRDLITPEIRGLPIAGYSAFDKSAWHATNDAYRLVDEFEYVDVLGVARRRLTLGDHKLSTVSKHLGLGAFEYHNPEADAVMAARVVIALAQLAGVSTLAALQTPQRTSRRTSTYPKPSPLPQPSASANPRHPLFGEVVCFTGELKTMTKTEAQNLAAEHGAIVGANVTKKTTLVVAGDFDPATLRDGAAISTKLQRAIDLAASGQALRIIDERDFLSLAAPA
ncbi:BRCT domain-containing protein [Frondihabitans sp. 4ASC-45]|uniref:BRCT domain-containing protein n=1 Tax=Frondihabitans sp. 4ASC-45 TaxID=3111636 RepID=UPI003C2F8496